MRRAIGIGLGLVAASALAADYRLTPLPDLGRAEVTVKIAQPAKAFRMPAWAPGDYQIFNYGRMLEDVRFRLSGRDVASVRPGDPNLWEIPEGADEVVYRVMPSQGNFTWNLRIFPQETFVSGPGVFGWFEGRAAERHTLSVDLTPADAKVECTLERLPAPLGQVRFAAPNYDELIDAPLVVGTTLRSASGQTRGKTIGIAGIYRIGNTPLEPFLALGQAAAEQGYQLFGELPFQRYVFFVDYQGKGGGLEHASSTRIGVYSPDASQAAMLAFHEFVHAYNVKIIRPRVLGPFDYTRPAVTGNLWWVEGVTDYYAAVMLRRAGLTNDAMFFGDFAATFAGLDRTSATTRVSVEEASRRVWENPGSWGFGGLSYYTKGRAIGFLLDVAIRTETGGKRSLDDVMRALYAECKNKPGFEENRIRELCVQLGGAALGPLYDECVRRAVPLPVARVLQQAGMAYDGQNVIPATQGPLAGFPMAVGRS